MCSKCLGDTVYMCRSCQCDLCTHCKEDHVKNLKTIDHKVVIYREKINRISKEEKCLKHPTKVYRIFCELCKVPVCNNCQRHRNHNQIGCRKAYIAKRHNVEETINSIRSDALLFRFDLLIETKADFKTFLTELSSHNVKLLAKVDILERLLDFVLSQFDWKHSCLKQNRNVSRRITNVCPFEHIYELSGIRPVGFLNIKNHLNKIKDICHLPNHTKHVLITPNITKNVVDKIESLLKIKVEEKERKRKIKKQRFKLMSSPKLHQSLKLTV